MIPKYQITLILISGSLFSATYAEAQTNRNSQGNSNTKSGPKTNPGVYKWTDEKGQVHFSTTVPPDAINNKIELVNKNGRISKVSEAKLSSSQEQEQRVQSEINERKRKQDRETQLRKKALLARYTSAEQIDQEGNKITLDWEQKISPLRQKSERIANNMSIIEKGNGSKLDLVQLRKDKEQNDQLINSYEQEKQFQLSRLQEDKKLWQEANGIIATPATSTTPPSVSQATVENKR